MSNTRVADKYYCGNDCAWGSTCKGHDISLHFHGSSETYSLTLDDRDEVVLLSRPQMWALVNLAFQIAEDRVDAGDAIVHPPARNIRVECDHLFKRRNCPGCYEGVEPGKEPYR